MLTTDRTRRLDFYIEAELPKRWTRWAGHYGALNAAWVGHPETSARRMALLVTTVLAGTLESINPSWTADIDMDAQGAPSAVILSAQSGARVDLVPLAFTGRTLSVGSQAVHLAGRRAGERIVELLAARAAAFFGRAS